MIRLTNKVYFGKAGPASGSGGGDTPVTDEKKKHIVRVIDYDGKILKEEFLYEGQTFKMPDVPTHERMTFNYWEGDEPIVDGYVFAQDYPVIFGAIYTVNSGKSEFDIEVPNDNYSFTLNMDGEKDWGDGNIDSLTSHTYATAGSYMILCDGQNITDSISPIVTEARFADLQEVSTTSYVFGPSKILKAVALNDGLSYMSTAAVGGLLKSCYEVKGIVYPKTLTSSQYVIGLGLGDTPSIKTVVLPHTILHYNGLGGSASLEYIQIPKSTRGMYSATFSYDANLKDVHIPEGVYKIGASCFQSCNGIDEIELPKTLRVFDDKVFQNCKGLRKVIINYNENLTTIEGFVFDGCSALADIEIPDNITSISLNGTLVKERPSLPGNISYMYRLKSYNAPSQSSFSISNCQALTELNLDDNIQSVSLDNDQYIKEIIAPAKLTSFSMYNCRNTITLDFDKCENIVTLSGSTPLYNMNSLVTIYVPFSLYNDWIASSAWASYKNYIKVKHPAYITFDIDSNDYTLYVNGVEQSSSSIEYAGPSLEYTCEDTLSKGVVFGSITGIEESDQITEAVSFSTGMKQVTVDTGVTGLNIAFYRNGALLPHSATDDGKYYVLLNSPDCTITYSISDDNYMDESGTIAFTGEDVTVSVTLTPATTSSWTRPDLTADGTLGGDSFAVWASNVYSTSTNYVAYKAVDNTTETFWQTNSMSGTNYIDYEIYNPNPLKISHIQFRYSWRSYKPSEIAVWGSNDGSYWTAVTSTYTQGTSDTIYEMDLTSSAYKYYKFVMKTTATYIRLSDMAITAVEKVPATQE